MRMSSFHHGTQRTTELTSHNVFEVSLHNYSIKEKDWAAKTAKKNQVEGRNPSNEKKETTQVEESQVGDA